MGAVSKRVDDAGLDVALGQGFGAVSWALGLAEVLAPNAILDWLGVDRRMAPLVRAYGLREIGAGTALLARPAGAAFMWARVAGDALDLLTLGAALKGRSTRPDRVTLALGVIGAITLLDVLASARLTRDAA